MNPIILLYTTVPSKEVALQIARSLLEKKLIACANIPAITSMYQWKDAIENSDEFVLLAKSTSELKEQLIKELKNLHPYETPAIFLYQPMLKIISSIG